MRFIDRPILCAVLLVSFGLTLAGCSSKNDEQPKQRKTDFDTGPPPAKKGEDSETNQSLDFTGLRGVLSGKWAQDEHNALEFAGKTIEQKRGGWLHHIGKFEMKGDLLHITDQDGRGQIYGLEFLSDGEIALTLEKKNYGNFNDLAGRWKRISLPPGKGATPLGTGPIADAKRQVQKIEKKLAKTESILKSALTDRDEYAAKLRSIGVNAPADLKGNIRGQRLAESLVKLANEIDGLERHLAVIDTELLKAKSLVRRMEQEQAGLSEVEMRSLSQQLYEAEERINGTPLPTTPLDVDAAVEKALKAVPKSTTPTKTK